MSDEKQASRIKVEDLPAAEKELSAEEAKNVKGGAWHELVILGDVAAADGSVKPEITSPRDPASGLPTGKRWFSAGLF